MTHKDTHGAACTCHSCAPRRRRCTPCVGLSATVVPPSFTMPAATWRAAWPLSFAAAGAQMLAWSASRNGRPRESKD
jgi:hypothetical protein